LKVYTEEYQRLVNEKYPEFKDSSFYRGYPYKIRVYAGKRGTLIEYQLNANNFEVEIERCEDTPKFESRAGYISDSYANFYFKRIINEPKLRAKRDIEDLAAFEDDQQQKEHLQQEEEFWEQELQRQEEEKIDFTVDGYLNYIKKSYVVQEKTFKEMKIPIFGIVQVIQNQFIMFESYNKLGCLTLFDTLEDTMHDLESSIFLVIHSKYENAMGLLRRYLETTLFSLYYDAEIAKYKTTSKTYEALNKDKEKWLEKSKYLRFTGKDGILDKLLDPDTDFVATETLKERQTTLIHTSFQNYVEDIYRHLSKFVHYGGKTDWKVKLNWDFPEFNEDQFKHWTVMFNQILEICNLLTMIKFPKLAEIYPQVQKENAGEQVFLLTEKQIEKVKDLLAKT
jgi:hypothetical protein